MLKVAIFNTYLSTWGGGERSTYAIAHAFAAQGFEVEVVTYEEQVPEQSAIDAFFGPGYDGFRIRSLKGRDEALREYLADKAIFVNHTSGSSFVNPCPLGIYVVMFPMQEGGAWVRSYHHFVCNSDFTRFHTLHSWGADIVAHTVHPGAGDAYVPAPARSNDILSIGRFNWRGHVKNQEVLVDAFEEIADVLPSGWRLVLLGRLNEDPDNIAAMNALRRRCRRLPVAFEVNVGEQRKRELLSSASLYWHATGVGRHEPRDMEHYGIAVVEAMRAGVVPLCYYRGGPAEIVEHARSGFLYRNPAELTAYTLALVARDGFRETMRARAIERSRRFDHETFDRDMASFVRSVVAV